jgi:hypothetical protein
MTEGEVETLLGGAADWAIAGDRDPVLGFCGRFKCWPLPEGEF